jgi:general secretion pathway protein D
MKHLPVICIICILFIFFRQSPAIAAAATTQPASATSQPADDGMIQLNLPENIEAKLLIEYVTKRLKINILYDSGVGSTRLTIYAPTKIPKSSLLGLLQSVLKISGLAMIDADEPGWKQIVRSKDLLEISQGMEHDPTKLAGRKPTTAITQVFKLEHVDIASVTKTIKPFLSTPGGNTFSIDEQRLLFVTDYSPNLRRIIPLVKMLDKSRPKSQIKFVTVKHRDAAALATQVTALLAKKDSVSEGGDKSGSKLSLVPAPMTNQIIVVAAAGADAEALKLIDTLDVASEAQTRTYNFKHVTPQRIDTLAKAFLGTEKIGSVYKSIIDTESGMLIVEGSVRAHERVAALAKQLDVPGEGTQTRTYYFKHVSPQRIDTLAKAFLANSKESGFYRSVIDAESGMLVVDAPKRVHERVVKLSSQFDVAPNTQTRTYTFKHVDPKRIDSLAKAFLGTSSSGGLYKSIIDSPSGMLVVEATGEAHERIVALARQFDIASDTQTKTYKFKHVDPRRIEKLARSLTTDPSAARAYKSALDAESGMLIVTAAGSIHDRIESLKSELDVPGAQEQAGNIRFYKLMNTTAAEVLSTIRAMDTGETGLASLAASTDLGGLKETVGKFTGPNKPPVDVGEELPKPPAFKPKPGATTRPAEKSPRGNFSVKTADAVITADQNTNSIIVIAPPAIQTVYKQLISILDKRRPQVMVEITLITLDTTDNYSLGVEISGANDIRSRPTSERYMTFSSFGLSTVDAATGGLSLIPGMGFNGTLISTQMADVVVKALATDGHTEVLSAPKLLVDDNATATLSSISEAPFTSVNASSTVSTTSFGGYAQAGTTVTITPHISEGDHIQLQYSITLNSFTGAGSAGIPPPRQTNTVDSKVTMPDGHTVIVGGLTRKDLSDTISKIPYIGDIPYIGEFLSSRTKTNIQSTLFVFIRPIILRDDEFEDLKFISGRDLASAKLPSAMPKSEPMIME